MFLAILARLSRKIISPEPLFISETAMPPVKLTPRLINLVPVGFVVNPANPVSIVALNDELSPLIG